MLGLSPVSGAINRIAPPPADVFSIRRRDDGLALLYEFGTDTAPTSRSELDRWYAAADGQALVIVARGPALNRALSRLSVLGARYMPEAAQRRLARAQRPGFRLLSPAGPTDDGPETLLDASPLYAGQTVARIGDVRPAADLVRAMTP